MPPVRMRGDGRKAKDPRKVLLRLLGYMKQYRVTLIAVVFCIILTAVASAASSQSLGKVVDDYITPMLSQTNPDFAPLVKFLTMMAGLYLLGMLGSFLQQWLMVKVSQGTQKTIRDQLFTHMQTLPIRYFDSHPAGDIMSCYTNDIDTLRQMISQSLPQCIASVVTLLVIFIAMLMNSWILTLIVIATVVGILFVTKVVAGKSGRIISM